MFKVLEKEGFSKPNLNFSLLLSVSLFILLSPAASKLKEDNNLDGCSVTLNSYLFNFEKLARKDP